MCGILGIAVNEINQDTLRTLFDMFNNQKNRGTEGAGISINNSELYRFRSTSPFRLFSVYNFPVWKKIKKGDRVLIHHRYPTSSPNLPKHNHPIADEEGKIHLIHNGCLYNYDTIYNELVAKGHVFETAGEQKGAFCITDSEVMVHLLEDYMNEGESIVGALKKLYEKVSGSYALAINLLHDNNIYLFRHNNPIVISKDKAGNHYFSSEKYSDNEFVCELAEGEIGQLNVGGYEQLDKIQVVETQSKMGSWGGYGYNAYGVKTHGFDEVSDKVVLGDKIESFIKKTYHNLKEKKGKMSYSVLCVRVFSALNEKYPTIDIENNEVRKAIRKILDSKE